MYDIDHIMIRWEMLTSLLIKPIKGCYNEMKFYSIEWLFGWGT